MKLLLLATPLSILLLGGSSAHAEIDKYKITPEEHAACDDDAISLCSDAYPDEDKLLLCMKANRSQLTPACRAALTEGLRRRHMAM